MMSAYKNPQSSMLTLSTSTGDQLSDHHEAASAYIISAVAPDLMASGIPDMDTTPCVGKSVTVRRAFTAPSTDFCLVPFPNSPTPHFRLMFRAAAATTATPADMMITNSIIAFDENLQANFERARLVSALTRVDCTLIDAATTDLRGFITAFEVDGKPRYETLKLDTISRIAIGKETNCSVSHGIRLVERPRIGPFQYLREVNATNSNNGYQQGTPKFGMSRHYGEQAQKPVYVFRANTIVTANNQYLSDDASTSYLCSALKGNLPNLSSSYRITLDCNLDFPNVALDVQLGPFRVEATYATINSAGAVTLEDFSLCQFSHVKPITNSTNYRFSVSTVVNEVDGLRTPDGHLVGLRLRSATNWTSSGVFPADNFADIIIEDLNTIERESCSTVAHFSGVASGTPFRLTAIANYEAVPDENLRQHLKPKSTMIGSQLTEAALVALLGEKGIWQSSYTGPAYDALLQDLLSGGATLRKGGEAYASFFGRAWDFLKPGFRALVPGTVSGITQFTGERFAKPLTMLGEEIFASSPSKGVAYASSFGNGDGDTENDPSGTPEPVTADVSVEVAPDHHVVVKANCGCSVQKNFAASVDCGLALYLKTEECLESLSELMAPEVAKHGCEKCFGNPQSQEIVRELIKHGLNGSPGQWPITLVPEGCGTQITLYASSGAVTFPDLVADEEKMLTAISQPGLTQSAGLLEGGVTRGSRAAALFRDLAVKGKIGETEEMLALLVANGSSVAAVTTLDTSENPQINYGKVTVTVDPEPGQGANLGYNVFPLPQTSPQKTPPKVYIRERYDSVDNRRVIAMAWESGLMHTGYTISDAIYVDFVPTTAYTRIEGTSHGAALLLALMGYTTDTVISASVDKSPGQPPTLGPVSQLTAKSKWCEQQDLRIITYTNSYKPYPARTVNQYDLDKGYKTIPTVQPDGKPTDSLFSGTFVFAVNNLPTLISLARDPRLVKGSTSEDKPTVIRKLAQEARAVGGDTATQITYGFDVGKSEPRTLSMRIETEEDAEAFGAAVRELYETVMDGALAQIFKTFKPALSSIVGQVPWNDETNAPAEKGEKSTTKRFGIKASFIKKLDNLMAQVKAAYAEKAPKKRKNKKGPGKETVEYSGLLEME